MMANLSSLKSLAKSYEPMTRSNLFGVARMYKRQQEQEVLDIAAIAVDVSVDSILNLGLEPDASPQLLEAFRRQFPTVDPDSLRGLPQEELDGYINGVKGKLFEILVVERLNNGETVGELSLPPGTFAKLAESPTQRGYDVEFISNDDGSLVDILQLKATTSIGYVKEAIEKNPDITVATTSDIESTAENIRWTDISNEHVEELSREHVGELGEDAITNVLHQSAEWVFDSVPIVPAIFVAISEGRQVLLGRSDLDEAMKRGIRRTSKSAVFTTMGATLSLLDAGILSVPATVTAKIAWNRIANRNAAGDFVASKTEEILLLTGM